MITSVVSKFERNHTSISNSKISELTSHDEVRSFRVESVVCNITDFHGNFTVVRSIVGELRIIDGVGGGGCGSGVREDRGVFALLVPHVGGCTSVTGYSAR